MLPAFHALASRYAGVTCSNFHLIPDDTAGAVLSVSAFRTEARAAVFSHLSACQWRILENPLACAIANAPMAWTVCSLNWDHRLF